MSKIIYFLYWILFFVMPLYLSILDSRMFFIVVAFVGFELWRTWTHFFGAEWLPIPDFIIGKMLKIADVKKKEIVYDLGSGDGKIVIAAAKLGAKAIGVEIDPLRILISRIKIKLQGLNRAKFIQGNFFKTNLRDADIVTLYLLPKTMEKIENKLRKELRKGARVVSYRFVFKNWKPVKVDKESKISLYKI